VINDGRVTGHEELGRRSGCRLVGD